jgi:hypothetical protein
VTAEFEWGPDEAHYSPHRYIVSAYVGKYSPLRHDFSYYLDDQYITVRRYDLEGHADVLASERPEILARLRRVKAGAEPRTSPAR